MAARYSGREGDRTIAAKLAARLKVLTGVVLLALALILGGCGGNEAQEEQQDVQEEQQDVQEVQEDLRKEQKDVEEEQQEIKEERQDEK